MAGQTFPCPKCQAAITVASVSPQVPSQPALPVQPAVSVQPPANQGLQFNPNSTHVPPAAMPAQQSTPFQQQPLPGMPIQNSGQAWSQMPQQPPMSTGQPPTGTPVAGAPHQGFPSQTAYAAPKSGQPKKGKGPIIAMISAGVGIVGIVIALLLLTGQDDTLKGIASDALDIADDAMAAVGSLDSESSGRAAADQLKATVDDMDSLLSRLESRLENSSKEELIEEIKTLLEDKSFQDKTAAVLKRAINLQESFSPGTVNLEAMMAFQTRINELGSSVDPATFEAKGERIGRMIEAKFSNPQDMLQLTGPMLTFVGAVSMQVPELQTIMNNGPKSFLPF